MSYSLRNRKSSPRNKNDTANSVKKEPCDVSPTVVATTIEAPKSPEVPKKKSRSKRVLKQKEQPKTYECDVCQDSFANKKSLEHHLTTHKDRPKEYLCDVCGSSFASRKSLSKHALTHNEDRPRNHLCDVCGVGFYDKETLKMHNFRAHMPKEARKYKCDYKDCRYSCLYQHQLLEHQKVHSDNKPWQCDQCNYTAKSKWSYKKHYRTHTQEKPFKCPHCSYASSLSSNLTRHLRIHTGSKPFKCPYCEYSCNNHENLRKHVINTKKHQGLSLYNCGNCPFGTNVFNELRKHVEQQHSDIYSIDEIDRMVSSVYHREEDKANRQMKLTQEDESDNKNLEEAAAMPRMILIHPTLINRQENERTVFIPTDNIKFSVDNNLHNQVNSCMQSPSNQSEVIIIDSDVLESEEIIVSEQTISKSNNQIIIAFSN